MSHNEVSKQYIEKGMDKMKKRTALVGLIGIGALVSLLSKVEVTVVKVEKAPEEPEQTEEDLEVTVEEGNLEASDEDLTESEIEEIQKQ